MSRRAAHAGPCSVRAESRTGAAVQVVVGFWLDGDNPVLSFMKEDFVDSRCRGAVEHEGPRLSRALTLLCLSSRTDPKRDRRA